MPSSPFSLPLELLLPCVPLGAAGSHGDWQNIRFTILASVPEPVGTCRLALRESGADPCWTVGWGCQELPLMNSSFFSGFYILCRLYPARMQRRRCLRDPR